MGIFTSKSAPVKSSKPARFIRLEKNLLTIRFVHPSGREEVFHYHFRLMASDFGEAFRLTNVNGMGGHVYDVCFVNDQDTTCECKGFLRHGHCKHVEGLRALRTAGKI